jgi:hypothetical protein
MKGKLYFSYFCSSFITGKSWFQSRRQVSWCYSFRPGKLLRHAEVCENRHDISLDASGSFFFLSRRTEMAALQNGLKSRPVFSEESPSYSHSPGEMSARILKRCLFWITELEKYSGHGWKCTSQINYSWITCCILRFLLIDTSNFLTKWNLIGLQPKSPSPNYSCDMNYSSVVL